MSKFADMIEKRIDDYHESPGYHEARVFDTFADLWNQLTEDQVASVVTMVDQLTGLVEANPETTEEGVEFAMCSAFWHFMYFAQDARKIEK